jgi:hypothetical protein
MRHLSHASLTNSSTLLRHTLVATPTMSRFLVQASSPANVLFRTSLRPRLVSLTRDVPSMLMSGVAFARRRSSRAISSVISCPFVKIWK